MMMEVRGLSHAYGARSVLHGIDLKFAPGEVVSLVGPNGAGKSTLLKCLNGVLRPGGGTVSIDGRSIRDFGRRELARSIAYVPQQVSAASYLPVVDMVALGRSPHLGLHPAAHDASVVEAVLRQLDLLPHAFSRFGELSGGERQMVLIARALAQEGRMILMDEPTNNLDLNHQLRAMTAASEVARRRNVAVIIAIHDLSLAARFSDRIVLLDGGMVRAEGPWRDVLTNKNLRTTYRVNSVIGEDDGLPYLLPASREDCSP